LTERANELRLSQERSARRERVLEAVPDGAFEDWSGQVTSLKTNSEGKAALAVALPCDVVLKTSVSAIGDAGRNTLIPQGSPLYTKLAALRNGQRVRVAGTFFSTDQDGYFELSLTEKGSMTEPEFLVRFLDVVPEGLDSSGARNVATLPTGKNRRPPISDYCEYGKDMALRMIQAHLARDNAASERISDEFRAFIQDESVPPLEKARMGECFQAAGVELGAIK
jgi:hypothetical protein